MKRFLVSYEWKDPDNKHDALIRAIKEYPAWCHVLKTQWFVCHSGDSTSIFNELRPHIEDSDRLLVSEFTGNHVGWLGQKAIDWLKNVQQKPVPETEKATS